MKKSFTLFVSIPLLLHLSVLAQSPLHIPFGQTLQEVQTFLKSRDYISGIEVDPSMNSITATDGRKAVEYRFQDDKLYAISTSLEYGNKKQADEHFKSCQDYFKRMKGDGKNFSDPAFDKGYVSLEDARIAQLHSTQNKEDGSVLVSMIITSRNYGPKLETEALARELTTR